MPVRQRVTASKKGALTLAGRSRRQAELPNQTLHDQLPALPYHNRPPRWAHLLQELPTDSPFRSLTQPGWWSVARHTLRLRNEHRRQATRSTGRMVRTGYR